MRFSSGVGIGWSDMAGTDGETSEETEKESLSAVIAEPVEDPEELEEESGLGALKEAMVAN